MISSSFPFFSILLNRSMLLHNGCTQRCGKRSIRITSDSFHSCTSELHWFLEFSLFTGSTVKMCTLFFHGLHLLLLLFFFFFYSTGGRSKEATDSSSGTGLLAIYWFTGDSTSSSFLPSLFLGPFLFFSFSSSYPILMSHSLPLSLTPLIFPPDPNDVSFIPLSFFLHPPTSGPEKSIFLLTNNYFTLSHFPALFPLFFAPLHL